VYVCVLVEAVMASLLRGWQTDQSVYSYRPTGRSVNRSTLRTVAEQAPTRERILEAAQRLVLRQGFGSTTVDQVLTAAGTSKGAFFHHFPTKAHLGRAIVARYAAEDARTLDAFLVEAEATSDDPAVQLVALLAAFEDASGDLLQVQPSCLFVSFIYERDLAEPETMAIVAEAIAHWRSRILAKLEAAAEDRVVAHVDLPSLADQAFTVFEGAFLLARALDDPGHLGRQLAHLRHYLELLFDLEPATGTGSDGAARDQERVGQGG
jgi:TetR/AcrR family transcriptional repressor of nem operon